jgi:hypothetical protein
LQESFTDESAARPQPSITAAKENAAPAPSCKNEIASYTPQIVGEAVRDHARNRIVVYTSEKFPLDRCVALRHKAWVLSLSSGYA